MQAHANCDHGATHPTNKVNFPTIDEKNLRKKVSMYPNKAYTNKITNSKQNPYQDKTQNHHYSSTSLPIFSPKPYKKVMYKSNTLSTNNPQNMRGAKSPIQIGTRGTVGSLIMREIEYFNRLEFGNNRINDKAPRHQLARSETNHKVGSSIMATKGKKKGGIKLIPRMCSMVEVAESKNYMNLKADGKKLQA